MDKVESNIKAAAEKKNDIERLGQFRGVDLIAKEFMTHKQCYLEYTRCLEDSEADNSDQNVDDKGDFEGVKAFINQAVLGCDKAVSISVVHEIYGTGFGQQYERSSGAKLKSKLISEYQAGIYIRQEANRLYHMLPEKPMDPLTKKQWKKYNRASRCHICFKRFGDSTKGPKACDHCHYTGRYRGSAHRNCNLMYRIPSYIPVVFHNLSGYDAHLVIRELGRHSRDTMEVLAKTKEDYISLSVKVAVDKYVDKLGNEKDKLIELRFIDSFKFMATSLDSLTRNLVGGKG